MKINITKNDSEKIFKRGDLLLIRENVFFNSRRI